LPPAAAAARRSPESTGWRVAARIRLGSPGLVVELSTLGDKGTHPMTRPLAEPGPRRLVVTGHPNHELAIFGFVQRTRPRFLFLTDGGGEHRVAESRRGLLALGLLDGARFLPTTELSLYEALLDQAVDVFAALVSEVRTEVVATGAEQVFCESVEFYNPLHDIVLPIVWAATRGLPGVEVWEFPLIAQRPEIGEQYRVQRMSPEREGDAVKFSLRPEELAAKLDARVNTYGCLHAQLGPVMEALDERHLDVEYFARARAASRDPGPQDCVRYEWRARHLRAEGEIRRIITHDGHVRPVVKALQTGS
jgi:hypothetical protein